MEYNTCKTCGANNGLGTVMNTASQFTRLNKI